VSRPRFRSIPAAVPLIAVLVAVSAHPAPAPGPGPVPARRAAACDPLPGGAPDAAPRARDIVALNFTNDMLDAADSATVELCVLVDSLGVPREVRTIREGTPYDSAAVDAVRWWLFEPARRSGRPVPARIMERVVVEPPRDSDPLVPDVLGLAREAEARGDTRDAIDAWTGALARVGTHPGLGNEWAIRERIARLAASLPAPPLVPTDAGASARGAHNRILRDISRATNADMVVILDDVLRQAPWYADAYRWRASARAACGQRAGAWRDVLCFRLTARDSMQRAVADRSLAALARGDTLAALTLLKY
jgi:hypothetical protein